MPSKKTIHQDRYLEYMEFVRDHCSLLTDRHRNRYPLAPVGRPPNILFDRPRPEGDRGNDHFVMKDNR